MKTEDDKKKKKARLEKARKDRRDRAEAYKEGKREVGALYALLVDGGPMDGWHVYPGPRDCPAPALFTQEEAESCQRSLLHKTRIFQVLEPLPEETEAPN